MDDSTQIIIAKASMVGGAATGGVGAWWTLNEYLAIGGFTVAVIGFAVNFYYAYKDDRRKELEHKLRLREMEL